MNPQIHDKVQELAQYLTQQQLTLATAESCTGGQIAAACTSISGSSAWFLGSIVSYANSIKEQLLNVPASLLLQQGAVSEPVVCKMAESICALTHADIGIAVSGIAGPNGGSADKPVGLVHFAFQINGAQHSCQKRFSGDRAQVQQQAVCFALDEIIMALKKK